MSRILVTGGAGFIGSHLVEALLARGHAVTILDDFSSGKRDNLAGAEAARVIEGDLMEIAALANEIGPQDIAIHLAALISGYDSLNDPAAYQRINVEGTQRLMDACGAIGVRRILFASSSTVYGDRGGAPLDEETLPKPLSVYALTKLAGEHLLRLYAPLRGFSHCSLRLFNVYGPRQVTDHPYANVTCKFSHAVANGLPVALYGDGDQTRDFVFVGDVVDALLAVLEGSEQAIYNVGTGEDASINDLLATLSDIGGQPLQVERRPAWPNDIRAIRADTSRMAAEFGLRARTGLRDGLGRTVDYFRHRR